MSTPEEYYSAAPPPEPVASNVADYFGPPPPGPNEPPITPAPPSPVPVVDMSAPPMQRSLYALAQQKQTPVNVGGVVGRGPPSAAPVTPPPAVDPAFHAGFGSRPPANVPQTGGTPEENAELARFEEGLKRQKPASAAGGAVVPVNPDPFGQKAATERLLGTYGDEAEARRIETANAQGKVLTEAQGAADLARTQQEDAAIANAERNQANQHFDQQMSVINQQLDAVRQRKIDPLAGHHGVLSGILAVLGGAMGGLYQGVNHLQSNPFLDDLNRQIDRNIAVQEKDLANAKEGLHDKLNLLGQQRAAFKDEQLAKLQTRNLYYEAAKQEIAAQAAPYQAGVIKAQGDQLISQVNRAQAVVQKQIADAAAAKSLAAAQQQAAREKAVRDIYKDTYFKLIESGASPEQAEFEARRMSGQLYGGAAPARPPSTGPGTTPLTKEGREKQQEAYSEVVGAHKSIYDFDPNKVSAGSTINAHWPNAINSSEGKAKNEERERYNSFVRQAVGSAWRLTTNGMEPKNQDVLEEQAAPFLAVPTDSAEDILRKQQNLGDHLSKAANSKGLSIPSGKPTVTLRNADGTPK